MSIKMIVTDLDGTLLRTDKTVSPYTADVLNQCRQNGILVVLATARPERTLEEIKFGFTPDAVILHNGAAVYIEDRRFFHCGIPPELTKDILRSIGRDNPDVRLSAEIGDRLYADFNVFEIWSFFEKTTYSLSDIPDLPAEKIIVGVSSMEDIERFAKYLTEDLYIEMNEGRLGLIMHRGATKLSAVSLMAEHFGCALSEVAAFGDDINDLGMIRDCGIGIAMGNALDEVKAAADYVCGINDEDGLARWLEERGCTS